MFISLRELRPKTLYKMIPKRKSRILSTLGTVLLFISLLMIPSLIIAIRDGDNLAMFLVPMIGGIVLGVYASLRFESPRDLRPADGLVMMFMMWMLMFFFGTLPYLIYGYNFIDSFFESVSGFSTTGASIIPDVTVVPKSLLIWRVMTNWIGGIIIVLMFMFIMPMVVSGGRSILTNEMSGSSNSNMFIKLGSAAKQFISVYVLLTAIFAIIYILLGVEIINGICLAMSTISIGGFVNVNNSLANYNIWVKFVTIIFLILSASNFYLHFRAVVKHEFEYRKSEEFRAMIIWFVIASLVVLLQSVTLGSWNDLPGDTFERVVTLVFTVVSFGTTMGFTALDTSYWPFLSTSVFLILMFIGGSSGSTSGGIKISRAIIILKAMFNEIRLVVHPNAVYEVKFDKQGLYTGRVRSSMILLVIFMIVAFFASMIFNNILELDESMFVAISLITNTGTSIGSLASDFNSLPVWAKLFSCLLMFLGRMEILTILVMFTPSLWKEFFGPRKIEEFKQTVSAKKYRTRFIENRKRKSEEKKEAAKTEAIDTEPPLE